VATPTDHTPIHAVAVVRAVACVVLRRCISCVFPTERGQTTSNDTSGFLVDFEEKEFQTLRSTAAQPSASRGRDRDGDSGASDSDPELVERKECVDRIPSGYFSVCDRGGGHAFHIVSDSWVAAHE